MMKFLVRWITFAILYDGCLSSGNGLINPNYQIVYTTKRVNINCNSHGLKTWLKDGIKVPGYLLKANNIYIDKAFKNHSGIYTCIGRTADYKPFNVNATVFVADEDHNMINPRSYVGYVGNSVQIDCKEGRNVQWFYENFKYNPVSPPIYSGISFRIANIKSRDSGTYFCYGQYLTKNSHFLSKSIVKIYDQSRVNPTEISTTIGKQVNFVCLSRSVVWYKDGNSIPFSKKERLIFESIAGSDQGFYECKGQYDNGEVFFARVHLKVAGDYSTSKDDTKTLSRGRSKIMAGHHGNTLKKLEDLSVKYDLIHPAFQIAHSRKTIQISCNSAGPKIWFKDGAKVHASLLNADNIYIMKASEVHEGIYTCEGKTPDKKPFKVQATVLVAEEKHNMIEPLSHEGVVGDTVRLNCKTGTNVKWYFEKKKYHPESKSIGTGTTLSIPNVQSKNNGNYFCYGKYLDRDAYFISKSTVKIYDQSRVHPQNIAAKVGQRVEFMCQSKFPIWYKGENIINAISRKEKLTFVAVKIIDEGYYTCRGQYDDKETFIAKVHLTVDGLSSKPRQLLKKEIHQEGISRWSSSQNMYSNYVLWIIYASAFFHTNY